MCGVPFDVYTDRMCTTGRYDGPVQMTRQANHHERLALPRNDPKRGRAGGMGGGGSSRASVVRLVEPLASGSHDGLNLRQEKGRD